MKKPIQETSRTHATRVDLPQTAIMPIVDEEVQGQPRDEDVEILTLLNQMLAEAIDLSSQLKQAHWNVKGSNFLSLHELFDRVHVANESYVDMVGERIVQLNGIAEGTISIVAARSRLSEYPLAISDGSSHIEAIARSMRSFRNAVRTTITAADEIDDIETVDIFTEISCGMDKWLWFVEAHTQSKS